MSFDLKKLAFDLQLKQKEVSEIIGVAQSQISAMMNGKREIKEEHIQRLRCKYGDIISNYFNIKNEGDSPTETNSINPQTTQTMDAMLIARDYIDTLKRQLVEKDEQIRQKDELIRRLTSGQPSADDVLSRSVGAIQEKQDELTKQ